MKKIASIGRKARYLFAVWVVGGNKTVLLNLMSQISGRRDLDIAWLPIEMYPNDWITKIPPISLSGVWRNSAATWLRIRPLRRRHGEFDAAYYLGYSIVTFLWRFRHRVPYALALDLTPLWAARNDLWYALPRFNPESLSSRVKHVITRSVFARASHLLPFSTGVRDSLVHDYGIPEERITVLPPGVDLQTWCLSQEDVEARERHAGPPRILFVGRDFRRKGGDLLVTLAARSEFQDVEFHFATDSYEGPALKNVHVHTGLVENSPELIAAYRNADIFVLPTRADTYSWVSLEAMAMGLPVIVGDVGGIADIVVDGETGFLVHPDDLEALAQHIQTLLSNPVLRREMGLRGRRRVEERFDLGRSSEKVVRLLGEISSNHSPTSTTESNAHHVTIDVVSDLVGLKELADPWNELASIFKTPLLRHEWFLAAAEAFCPPGKLSVFVVRDQGSVVAIAPLVLNPTYGSRRLEILGAGVLEELTGFLYRSPEALHELLRAIFSTGRPLYLKGLLSDSLEAQSLRQSRGHGLAYSRSSASASPWIPIKTSWEDFSSTISSSWRSNLRRAQRRAEEFGKVKFEMVAPNSENMESLLAEIYRVESAGWKSRTQTSLASYAPLNRFFATYAKSAVTLGALRFAFLRINGKAVAVQLLIECANRLWVLKVGYDEAYARCSPGILLMHKVIQAAFEKGYEAYELLGANEPWIGIWKPQVHDNESIRRYPVAPLPVVSHGLELSADTFRRIVAIAKKNKDKGVLRSLAKKAVEHLRRTRQAPAQ